MGNGSHLKKILRTRKCRGIGGCQNEAYEEKGKAVIYEPPLIGSQRPQRDIGAIFPNGDFPTENGQSLLTN
jgi:hypothetical protein